jgi:hypothetical protein
MPFCRRLDMEYPSGIRHIIFNCATPVSDGQIQVVQILYRNDTEVDCSTQELIDWDAAIIAEDQDMLESTDPDAIVDMGPKDREAHAFGSAGNDHAQAPARIASESASACRQAREY